jgi:hypothetical protein
MTTVVSNTLKCACAAMFVVCHAGLVHAPATRSYSPGFCTPVFNGQRTAIRPTQSSQEQASPTTRAETYMSLARLSTTVLNYPLFVVSIYVSNPSTPVGSLATSVSCSLYGLQGGGRASQSNGTSSRSGSAEIYLVPQQGGKASTTSCACFHTTANPLLRRGLLERVHLYQ